jgi:hypothetical protein
MDNLKPNKGEGKGVEWELKLNWERKSKQWTDERRKKSGFSSSFSSSSLLNLIQLFKIIHRIRIREGLQYFIPQRFILLFDMMENLGKTHNNIHRR